MIPHALFYAAYYAMVGVLIPYLPAYLTARGFSGIQLGILLAFSPLMLSIAPLASGYLADRTRQPLLLLRVAIAGAAISILLVQYAPGFALVSLAILGYAAFQAPIIALADAMTIARFGPKYTRIRPFGSLGFVVTALSVGGYLDYRGAIDETVVVAASAALALALLSTAGVRAPETVHSPVELHEARSLLGNKSLRLLLAASLLHWAAMAPYHSFFSVHVEQLGLPTRVIGASMALGALVEVGVMFGSDHILCRFDPQTLLAISFAASAVRWFLTSIATAPIPVILVQGLHGVSFGAFYVAAIGLLVMLVPDRLRATGQGLFMAAVFGIGGGIGTVMAGVGFDLLGGAKLYLTSCAVSIVSLVIALRLRQHVEARR